MVALVALLGALGVGASPVSAAEPSPEVETGIVSVTTGGTHACAVTGTGTGHCWGADDAGQLGDGTAGTGVRSPRPMVTGSWSVIDGGSDHTCGLTTDQEARCWGWDVYGQLGDGGSATDRATPTAVAVDPEVRWTSISAGELHSCGVTTTGLGSCWGRDDWGQLGDGGATTDSSVPVPVATPDGVSWASVSAGSRHTCAVTTTGLGYCWGWDEDGQLGDGTATAEPVTAPVPVVAPDGVAWASLSAGRLHTCGITTTGLGYCWGADGRGQLGNGGGVASSASPSPIAGGHDWISLSAGIDHTCGVTSEGIAYCWGSDDEGAIGNASATQTDRQEPTRIGGPAALRWSAVSVSRQLSCALTTAGAAWCWGLGAAGQVGDGNAVTQSRPAPEPVAGLTQTITVDGPVDGVAGDSFTVTATATSGLPVAIAATGGCTASGTTVTLTRHGSCTVTATQPGDDVWAAATPVVRTVTVANTAPVVDAGPASTVDGTDEVTLTASASDADGDVLTYEWEQTSGTPVTLDGADTATASFTAPFELTVLGFRVTVSDGAGGVTDDSVLVTVIERRFAGQVLSGTDGSPVAGVRVRLHDGTTYLPQEGTTDDDGRWQVLRVPAGTYRVEYLDPSLDHLGRWHGGGTTRASGTRFSFPGGVRDIGTATLTAGAVVAGTIATPGSYDVFLFDRDPTTATSVKVLRGVSGSFAFRGLVAGTYYVLVDDPTGARADLWGPNRYTRADALPIPVSAGDTATTTYEVPPQRSISGVVTGPDGPVAGATVQLYDAGTGAFYKSVRADEDGVYRMTSVRVGTYKVAFRDTTGVHLTVWHGPDGGAADIGSATAVTMPANGALTLDQEMAGGPILGGTVTGDGAPLAGAKVTVYRAGSAVKVLTTAADGTWSYRGLTPGTYTVGYGDPGKAFLAEYHEDRRRLADADPIVLAPGDDVAIEADLAPR